MSQSPGLYSFWLFHFLVESGFCSVAQVASNSLGAQISHKFVGLSQSSYFGLPTAGVPCVNHCVLPWDLFFPGMWDRPASFGWKLQFLKFQDFILTVSRKSSLEMYNHNKPDNSAIIYFSKVSEGNLVEDLFLNLLAGRKFLLYNSNIKPLWNSSQWNMKSNNSYFFSVDMSYSFPVRGLISFSPNKGTEIILDGLLSCRSTSSDLTVWSSSDFLGRIQRDPAKPLWNRNWNAMVLV